MNRAVVFDIGGVLELVEEPAPWVEAWEHRLGLHAGELRDRVTAIWQRGRTGIATFEEIEAATADVLRLEPDDSRRLWEDMWEWYLGEPNEPLLEYFELLGSRCRTAILSNSFVGARERENARYGYEARCELVIYSHEEGLEKPDPRFYLLVCQRLGVEPTQVVFVDDVEVNVVAARDLGMRGVLFQDTDQTIADIEDHLAGGAKSDR